MALLINKATPAGGESIKVGDNEIRDLKTAIQDIFGIPDDTTLTNALLTVVAAGLNKVHFQDLAGDPSAAGELARNSADLLFHDGTAARSVLSGWRLLQSQTASASATVDFTSNIDSTYDLYMVVLSNILPATDSDSLFLRVSQSSSFKSGASDYEWTLIDNAGGLADPSTNSQGDIDDSEIQLTTGMGNATGEGFCGTLYFSEPDATSIKRFWWHGSYTDNDGTPSNHSVAGAGVYDVSQTAIDGIRFLASSGNITSGTFALYGLVK